MSLARQVVDHIRKGEWSGTIDSELFSRLGSWKAKFLRYLESFSRLPRDCEYALCTIGSAYETQRRNFQWKSHLMEKSKSRLNISKTTGVEKYLVEEERKYSDSEGVFNAEQFCSENRDAIEFLFELGYEFQVYGHHYWRRGTDIELDRIMKIDDFYSFNDKTRGYKKTISFVQLFLVDPGFNVEFEEGSYTINDEHKFIYAEPGAVDSDVSAEDSE
jgi:hypothetical protein